MEQACVGSAGGILWKPVVSRLTFVFHGFFSVVRAISSSSDFPLPDTCDWFIIEALSAGVPSPSTCRRAFSGISAAVNSFPNFFHSIIAGGYHPTSISAVMATSLANSRRQHGKFLHMSQRGQSHFLVIIVESVERQSDIRSKLLEQSDGLSGTKIHASCKKIYLDKLTRKLSNVLSIGMWRNIENFSINNPSVSYRPTNHQYKINFIYGTDITPSTILNDSMFLSLVDFQTIQSGVEDPNILIDVIGQVSDLGALETVQCSAGEDSVICLLRFVKIGTYRNEIQISNSYNASQVFFNPPIMEAEAFLKRDVASNALTLVESNQDKLEREIRRDPWMQYAIRDIVELRQSTQVQDSCMGERWYWRSLLMLFDWIASGIVPENAAGLLNGSFDELKDVESFPEAITSLIGKTFMFGVYIESNNVSSKGGMYKVGKVWKNLSMLLIGGSTTESFTQSDVGTNNLSCSQGSILLMDSEANEDTVLPTQPNMKNKEDNARKRKTNTQPIFLSPPDSKSSAQTKSDIGFRSVLRDVTNLHPTLPSSGSTQDLTHPSTTFNSANPYYDKAKGKQPQCSKRFRANGDYNNKASQLSDITTTRSTCLNIQPRNLLPAFSKSDSVKKPNPMEWPTSQQNEAEEEDDFQSSVNHSSSEEGEDYSDQSYDVSSEDSESKSYPR
ncbi:hypothetical protein DY000_02015875 [Brassica cretica]|uniref:Replication protein A 70 kDa DNA-binding subunit B/D first OB fold domain-containing protein n=1 Tax=Brassica cretica TaxID=69181 RepID=A0ABQ7D2S0_BRACR|nr:hypothetical protein DY000_02015875 [Brassica cretica]